MKTQYAKCHNYKDLELSISILKQKYPDYDNIIDIVLKQKKIYINNMFIMKYNLFNDYMNWLFSILNEAEKTIVLPKNLYQQRALSFIAERLFNFYIYKLKQDKNIKIKELPIVFINTI